jgi:hypothetical protein
MGMPGSSPLPGFPQGDPFIVVHAERRNFGGRIPRSPCYLAEIPGVTLAAREVAARLINGEVVLGPGKVNGLDAPRSSPILLPEGHLTGQSLLTIRLGDTASPCIPLLNQVTLSGHGYPFFVESGEKNHLALALHTNIPIPPLAKKPASHAVSNKNGDGIIICRPIIAGFDMSVRRERPAMVPRKPGNFRMGNG